MCDRIRSIKTSGLPGGRDARGRKALDDKSGRLVGFIVYCMGYWWPLDRKIFHTSSSTGFMSDVIVHPQFWRRGIGTLLVRAAEVDLAKMGADKVTLYTGTGNTGAQAFFAKLGYVESFGREDKFADPHDLCRGSLVSVDKRVQPSESTPDLLNCISNSMRRLMILSLAGHEQLSFSQLMRLCGLSPRYDTTGTFVYHLSQLTRIGVVGKVGDAYSLTPIGKRVHRIVGLLERESRFLDKREKTAAARSTLEGGVVARQALGEDNPAVAELVASEYFEQASRRYEVPRDYYERRKRETDFTLGVSGRNLVFLAQRDGEAVGVCWWTLIEREAVGGNVNKEAFLEHLHVRPECDQTAIAERLMRMSIQILLEDEKTTILNVWHSKDEPLGREFYSKFDIAEPDDLQLLMYVAQWARPTWKAR